MCQLGSQRNELPFYSRLRFRFSSGVPVEGSVGDVSWLSSHHMSDQSPSPSHNDGTHAALAAASEMLVEDGLGPEHFQDSSKVLGVEGGQFVRSISVIFQHSEP